MSTTIKSGSSGTLADVDSAKRLETTTEKSPLENPSNVGSVKVYQENDDGTYTGLPYLKSAEVDADYRLRIGADSNWDTQMFNATAQNFNKHKYTSTTLTMTWGGGFLTTNGGNVTTTGTACQIQTYKHFPLLGTGSAYVEMSMAIASAVPTNMVLDFGAALPAAAGTSLFLDGVYFRLNSSGLVGVLNNNGTETTTSPFTGFTFTLNQVYKFIIVVNSTDIEFWVNDGLLGELPRQNGTGMPVYSGSLPIAIRQHHTGATSTAFQAKFANYNVNIGGVDTDRLWATAMAGQGMHGLVAPDGFTAGQTSNNANSAAPTSATLSNTAAGYTTLGGQFQFAAVAGAETDYALFAYQVTAPTTSITGRSLIIRGIWIDSYVTGAAIATTSTLLQWSAAVGSTAVSLATADAAATRSPKRISLGVQSFLVGAAIGARASDRIDVNLDAPITVEPGTFFHIILKIPVSTATASQIIRGIVGVNSYWE